MRFQKDAIRTSVLTILALGVVVFTVLLVGVPGVFKKQYEVFIFFDNAAGIQLGANVMVAGRKVGQVASIFSPLPPAQRPAGHPNLEVKIGVQISEGNKIYKDATAMMLQQGLLGSMVIDFVKGSPDNGFAEQGTTYIGNRRPDFTEAIPELLDAIKPVTETAEETLDELKTAAERLEFILGEGGPLAEALYQIRDLADNLSDITAKDGALTTTLEKFGAFAQQLSDKEGALQQTLANLQDFTDQLNRGEKVSVTLDRIGEAAGRLDSTLAEVEGLIGRISPELRQTLKNTEQMTNTLKRQPWRLIWPSTKKYPPDDAEIRRAIPVEAPRLK